MPVQSGPQTLLIKVMGDQANASSENEEAVEDPHVQVILGLFRAEGSAVTH